MAAVSREAPGAFPAFPAHSPHPPPLTPSQNSSVLVTSSLLEDLVSLPLPFLISSFVSVLGHTSLWFAFLFSDLYVTLAEPLLSTYYVLCPEDAEVREKTRQESECNRAQGSTGKGDAVGTERGRIWERPPRAGVAVPVHL